MIPDEKLDEAMDAAIKVLPEGTRIILITLDKKAERLDEANYGANFGEARAMYVLATILRAAVARGTIILPVKNN